MATSTPRLDPEARRWAEDLATHVGQEYANVRRLAFGQFTGAVCCACLMDDGSAVVSSRVTGSAVEGPADQLPDHSALARLLSALDRRRGFR